MYENKTRKRTLAALMCLCILAALVLSGCGGNLGDGSASQTDSEDGTRFKMLSDFSGAHFGAVTGSTANLLMKGIIENPDNFSYYNSIPDAVEALKIGKLDAVVTDEPVARLSVSKNSGIKVFEQPVVADNYGYAFQKGSNLTDKFSEVIRRFKADGTLDALKKKWTGSDDSAKTLPEQTWAGSNGVIRYYHDYTLEPMAYAVGDGSTLGLEIDLMLMIAKELDYKVEMTSCEFGALIASLESGKADVVSGSMSITEERKKKVDFAETHYEGALVLIMQDAGSAADGARFKTLSDFSGAHFGAVTGSTANLLMKGIIEDPDNFSYYNSIPDAVEALKIGKLDAVVTDEPVARLSVSKNSGIKVFEQPVVADNYGYAFQKGSNLTDKFSEVIRRFKADGTLDSLKKKWTGSDDSAKTLPEQNWAGSNGVIRYYHDYTLEPMAYAVGDGSTLGLEIDLMLMIAKELDYKVEMTSCEFGALIASLESGKADVVSGSMSITEERKKKVDFAETHYEGALVLIMQDAGSAADGTGFWQYISEGFKSTFVTEGRWKLIASGLGVTVLISVLSGVFGLILGFGICTLRRLRNKPSKLVSAVFVRLVQGTPVVVLLMILYYIIFGSADVSGIVVSIVGFSINFGAYSSEIMRSGIEVVDKGQLEAALAMGFNKFKTFSRIIFPQAARNFLPVLRGEFISMVKTTSVVGYIAVQDMTKVSDIIRSNSMEAFFPLIVTAMLYFAIANLMTGVLSYIEHKLKPKQGKKTLKGVVIK